MPPTIPRPRGSRASTISRLVTTAAVSGLVLPTLLAMSSSAPVSADDPPPGPLPSLSLDKSAPTVVLAGEEIGYRLDATNNGDEAGFNLSFRDVLPAGVSFVPGSVEPADLGDPREIVAVDPDTGLPTTTTLIWTNVADLQPAETYTLSYRALPDPDIHPVGSVVGNEAGAYVNTSPRWVPRFDPDGLPTDPGGGVTIDALDDVSTDITSIIIDKSEPSPEGELLRGVQTQATTFTLDIRTTAEGGHTDVVVVDRLPAGMEFLGCGATDNSSPPQEEYPGSGPLDPAGGNVPLDPWDLDAREGCLTPISVETSTDGGVTTVVTWDLGALPAGAQAIIRYRAGIPLLENTADFAGPAPALSSLEQGANLDNNLGASTREGGPDGPGERSLQNLGAVSAMYLGPVLDPLESPLAVADSDTETVTIEDVRMQKRLVEPERFVAGGIATFEINVDVSEYVDAAGIVIIDTLPDGMCPLVPDSAVASDVDPLCDFGSSDADPPGLPVASVTHDPASGQFTVEFEPITGIEANDSFTFSYQVRMLNTFTGTNMNRAGRPIVAGDSFTNRARLDAETDPIPGTGEEGTWLVDDDSEANLGTQQLTEYGKRILPRYTLDNGPGDPTLLSVDPGDPGATCPTDPDAYVSPDSPAFEPGQAAFRLGDIVCFILEVEFPSEVRTRNPEITDFLPAGVEYIEGSAVEADGGTPNVVIAADVADPPTTSPVTGPTFLVGALIDPDDPTSDRFADLGEQFRVVLAGRIVDIPDGDEPDVRGNLLKLRTENTAGQAQSYRDELEFLAVPGAQVDLVKGVASVDSPAAGPFDAGENGLEVHLGSVVMYRIDVTNTGGPDNFTDVSARGIEVWDLLPTLIECGDVDDVTDWVDPISLVPSAPDPDDPGPFNECLDPGDPDYPPSLIAAGDPPSLIRWSFPSPDVDGVYAVAPGDTRTLTYTVTMPGDLSAGLNGPDRIENRAGVRELGAFSNEFGIDSRFIPENNIDPDDSRIPNTSEAIDDTWVFTPSTSVDKTGSTEIVQQPGNNLANQAVIGELVFFTIAVEVPPLTAVHHGVLTDELPDDLVFVSIEMENFYDSDGGPALQFPPGFTAGADDDTVTLTFPDTYVNDSDDTHRFELEIVVQVVPTSNQLINNQTAQPSRDNTAVFTSRSSADPDSPTLAPQDDDYTIRIRQPRPTLEKSNDAGVFASGGDTITYTLLAGTEESRPALNRAVVVDCLPAPLEFAGPLSVVFDPDDHPGAAFVDATTSDGSDECDSGDTRLEFTLGTLLPGDDNQVEISFDAEIPVGVVGGTEFVNTAVLTGNSLEEDPDELPGGRIYTAADDSEFVIRPLGLTKTVDPEAATIGQEVEYTIAVVVPANETFPQAIVVDTIPAGLTDITFLDAACTVPVDPQSTCTLDDPIAMIGPVPDDPTAESRLGFTAGDVTASTVDRLLTVRYTALVADIDVNQAGDGPATFDLVNLAETRWLAAPLGPNDEPVSESNIADYDWDFTGSSDTAELALLEPSLSIDKTVEVPDSRNPGRPEPGDTFTYTVTVTNADGPTRSDAFEIEVTDLVPLGVVVDPDSLDTASGTATFTPDAADPAATGGSIEWSFDGPLAPGDAITLTYEAEWLPSDELSAGDAPFVNTATVDRFVSLGDPDADERREYVDVDSTTAEVTPAFPELDVTKTVLDTPPANIGGPVTWRIDVTNDDDAGGAFAVDVVDTLPPNWTYVTDSARVFLPGEMDPLDPSPAPGITTDADGRAVLTWTDVADLAPGEMLRIEFEAVPGADVVTDPGVGSSVDHENLVEVTAADNSGAGANADGPYTADDSATTRIDAVDLLLTKTGPAETVAGTEVEWTIVVSNPQPDPDVEVDVAVGPFTVVDTLPPGVSDVSATGDGWACVFAGPADPAATGGTVTCTRTDGNDVLGSGAQFEPITVSASIPADAAGIEFANTATVTSGTYELDPSDNTDTHTTTTTAEADLRVVKTGPATVTPGETVTWFVSVVNDGPSDSVATDDTPITIVDQIPGGTSVISVEGAPWVCDDAVTGQLTCEYPFTIPAGESAPVITIVADVAPDVFPGDPGGPPTQIINSVTVSAGVTDDPDDSNDTDTHESDVAPSADLVLSKERISPDDVIAGEPVIWELIASNEGPSDAQPPITIVDTLPDGFTYASHTGPWVCEVDGQEVTCLLVADPDEDPLDPMGIAGGTPDAPIEAEPLVLTATTDPSLDPGTPAGSLDYLNTATVSSPTPDPDDTNNTGISTGGLGAEADLEIAKDGPTTAIAGEQISWTLTVTNNGPSDSVATDENPIVVTDTLPDEVAFVDADGDGWACAEDAGVVTCTRDATLPAAPDNVAPSITVTVDIDPSAGEGDITNTAAVAAGVTLDPVTTNNSTTHTVAVTEEVELSIAKTTTGADPVIAGETTEFTIVVTNAGPSTAQQVIVVDDLPTGLLAEASSGAGWVCTPTPTPDTPATSVSCTLDELLPGPSTPLVITARAASSVADGSQLTNTATVSTITPGNSDENNTATSTVDVIARADLAVVKSHAEPVVLAGDDVVFTIEVENLGPSDAIAEVTITDTLPAGFRYVTASGPWDCTAVGEVATGQTVTCILVDAMSDPAPLGAGATAGDLLMTVALDADLAPSSDPDDPPAVPVAYVNLAAVASPTIDPEPGNDESPDTVVVATRTNVSIAKTHAGPIRIGDPFTFTLQVRNDGPSTARDVQVVDTLPAALELDSVDAAGWTCGVVDRTITCDLDDPLPPATDADPIEVTVVPTADAYPSITNTASVTTSTPETDLDDNTSTDTVIVPPLVNLAIDKTGTGQFVVGGTGGYTLTITNAGPTTDPGPVTVVDVLPAGLTPVSVAPAANCTISGQRVECVLPGVLTVGSSRTVTITTEVGPAALPSVTNTATVSTPSEDTDLSDNTDSDTRPVIEEDAGSPPPAGGGDDGDGDDGDDEEVLPVPPDPGLPVPEIPATGTNPRPILVLALALVLLGIALWSVRRRHRTHDPTPSTAP